MPSASRFASAMIDPAKPENPFRQYADKPEAYLDALLSSVSSPDVNGVRFPSFPPAELQDSIHGHSNETALREAFKFASICREHVTALRGGFGEGARLLDFGSGWGRIVRPFMPHFDLDKIVGVEPNERIVRIARAHNSYVTFLESDTAPPLPFADRTFDVFTSWSVFSHLPEELATKWIEEFARLARPGALMFLTTWGAGFLNWLDEGAAKMERGEEIHWYRKEVLGRCPGERWDMRSLFDAGQVIHIPQNPRYGDTLIPRGAMQRMCPSSVHVMAEDTTRLGQTLFVLQKEK